MDEKKSPQREVKISSDPYNGFGRNREVLKK